MVSMSIVGSGIQAQSIVKTLGSITENLRWATQLNWYIKEYLHINGLNVPIVTKPKAFDCEVILICVNGKTVPSLLQKHQEKIKGRVIVQIEYDNIALECMAVNGMSPKRLQNKMWAIIKPESVVSEDVLVTGSCTTQSEKQTMLDLLLSLPIQAVDAGPLDHYPYIQRLVNVIQTTLKNRTTKIPVAFHL